MQLKYRMMNIKKFAFKLIVIFLGIICSAIALQNAFEFHVGSKNIIDFLLYYMDNMYYVLVWFPILVLYLISGNPYGMGFRYTVLLRFRSKQEYMNRSFGRNLIFIIMFIWLSFVGIMLVGTYLGLSMHVERKYILCDFWNEIVIYKFLNIICYLGAIVLIYMLLETYFKNYIFITLITMLIPVFNLFVIKSFRGNEIFFTPWGNIAYKLYSYERTDYTFYWGYWLLVAIFIYVLYSASMKRDIVYEKDKKHE